MTEWLDLWNKLLNKKKQTDISWRFMDLADQVGSIGRAIRYNQYHEDYAYQEELRIALADAYAQLRMLIYCSGWSFKDIEELGKERLAEAIQKRLPK